MASLACEKKEAEEKKCPVQRAIFYVEGFLEGPMCGRCFPCALGSYEAKIRLRNLIEGRGDEEDIAVLKRIADDMLVSSFCKKGKDTARFLLEWMEAGVFEEHLNLSCRDRECTTFIEYRIVPEKCIMCGLCKEACEYKAIIGEKKEKFRSGYHPFEIRQKRCVKCGACKDVCPTEAVIVIESGSKITVKV